MSATKESAEAVFERITRRRHQVEPGIEATVGGNMRPAADMVDPPPSAWQAAAPAGIATVAPGSGKPLQVDEILSRAEDVARADVEPPRDTFPRSATMRFILNNPTLALGVGLPAAAMLLKSQSTRRALRLALEVGTRPGMQELIGISAATARLMRTRDAQPVPPAGKRQKKAP